MRDATTTRAEFIDRVLTSQLPGQQAKRFPFADGEVGVLYTLGYDPAVGRIRPMLLYVATFPPSLPGAGQHDFGIDYTEQPVDTAEEATELLASFGPAQAAQFRAACRPAAG